MKSGKLYWYLQRYSALYFILFLVYIEYTFWTTGITFQFLTSNNLFKALNKLLLVKNWKVIPVVQNVYSIYTRNKMK